MAGAARQLGGAGGSVDKSSRPGRAESRAASSVTPRRSKGSPPVRRTRRVPSRAKAPITARHFVEGQPVAGSSKSLNPLGMPNCNADRNGRSPTGAHSRCVGQTVFVAWLVPTKCCLMPYHKIKGAKAQRSCQAHDRKKHTNEHFVSRSIFPFTRPAISITPLDCRANCPPGAAQHQPS